MVRETRYLLVGNLPENTTENDITEYFKRFGRIQKVKIERKPEEKEEKEEGSPSSTLTATVAFTDIKSASNAHKADKKLSNNTLTSEYSEGFGATGSVVTRTHEPEHYPRPAGFPPTRKGFEEEADGFDVYYGTTSQFNESPGPYSGSSPFSDRGRPRERWPAGAAFPGRGAKWTPGTRVYPADGSSKDGFEKPKTTSSIPASSPTHSTTQSSEKHGKKKKKSKSVDRSRSSSGSSRSSSSSNDSVSPSSSKERPKSTVAAAPTLRSDSQDSAPLNAPDIEPGEREPLGIYITKLPLRSSDSSLRDGLFHEYKKYGKITAVQVSGVAETRFAIVSFKQTEDATKALEASKDKRFFGTCIHVVPHEGLEVDDPDFGTPEQQLDEHSPKATRTLFLGNLEKDITIEELKEKLDKYGEILDVDVKRQGAISAYAFIQFTDITSVVRSLRDLDGMSWGSSKLKVGFGKSMATSVIWLDNLAETVNEGFLYRQFGRFGGISHAVVDRVKRKGLVFFLSIESAQYALPEMRNRIWNGKKIHIDFASRDCQESFFLKMEQTNQLRPGERPDQRWMQKQMQSEPFWDESVDAINTSRRGSFTQVGRGRGRFLRGRGAAAFRGRGTSFEVSFSSTGEEFTAGRRQTDEISQGSGAFLEDDYEAELRDYTHNQRERRERSSQSPPGYEDVYYEAGSQSGRDYSLYDKHRYPSYRSASPGSDREMDTIEDDYITKYKARTPSDDRYYYKDKFYEESKSRDRSHSSDSETRFRLSSEIVRRNSRSRSPTMKLKRTKELPISYRSQSPPTPTDDEPSYYRDGSPTDFDSAYRKYDYKKRLSSSADGDKKSDIYSRTGLRKEIEAKSEELTSRKRSYDQLSPSRSDSVMRLERQHSRGSKSGSAFDYNDKQSAKELISKVNRLKSEVHERTFGKDSPSSGSSYGEVDTSNMSEAELAKLHREKQKLLDKLTLLDDTGNNSDSENMDTRRVVSKKARLDSSQSGLNKYLHKSDSLTKQEIKEKLKMLDSAQSSRKQLEALQKKELLRELKKSKSSDAKKDLLDYSDDERFSVNSPHDLSGFRPKKRRKVDGESDRKSRSYRSRHDDEQGYSSDDDKDRQDLLSRQISAHSDLFTKSRSGSMDVHLDNDLLYSHNKDDSRRTSSGSDNNKDSGHSRGRHRRKKEDHITPLIPLGDDDMPDPETADPRTPREKMDSPMVLPLPDFAQFIQFSPLPSPHRSPEYSDLPLISGKDSTSATATAETTNADESPCFSPQSSSSKTHSPPESLSGSGSESKANTNSDSNELPLGFPKDTVQADVGEENKPDSLDSLPDPTKLPNEVKEDNDSFSDNNSDTENLSSENLSIDERIRRLDEKWSKAQAVVVASTHKIIPDVESVVNPSTSSVLGSLSVTPTTSITLTTVSSPNVTSLYSKYRIRKKNDPSSMIGDKSEPSEIVQTVLSKSSIFDQDSRRLGQYGDNFESKDNVPSEESTSTLPSVWNKLDTNKDAPMVTVPGSLMDRLGQTQNVSFPTLTVNTTLTNSLISSQNVSSKHLDSQNSSRLNISDNIIPKTSPGILVNSNSANVDTKLDLNTPSVEQNNLSINSVTLSTSQKDLKELVSPTTDIVQKSPNVTQNENSKNRSEVSNSKTVLSKHKDTPSGKICDKEEAISSTVPASELPNKSQSSVSNGIIDDDIAMDTSEPIQDSKPQVNDEVVQNSTECVSSDNNKSVKETVSSVKSEGAKQVENNTKNIPNIETKIKEETEIIKKETVKKEDNADNKTVKESRTAFDVDIFSMATSSAKRKLEDSKSEKVTGSSKDSKQEVKKEKESSNVKDVNKTDQKPSTSEKSKSDKVKHSSKDSSKSDSKPDSTKEPSSKKQKISKDKKSESSHKDDKKKSEKKESSHKTNSEKKDEKKDKDKHKTKTEKDKKESDKKSSKEKEAKDEKKKKSETKEKDTKKEEKEKKEDKKEKYEDKEKQDEKKEKTEKKKEPIEDKKEVIEDKKDKSEEKKSAEKREKDKADEKKEKLEKKEKEKTEKKDKDKHEKKDNHKHDKHKTPEKRSKSANKDDENKETSKESTVKDDKAAEKKKEHKSSSSHKSKKSKEEVSSKKSNKDDQEVSSKKSKDDQEVSSKKSKDDQEVSSKKSKEDQEVSSKKSKDDQEVSSKKSKDDQEVSSKKSKDDQEVSSKKSKDDQEVSSKKSKDDHGEHKKKEESNNRNNKDSPDKSKDTNRKDPSVDKKESNTIKEKEKESSDKCNDQKSKEKEKENKDKDPDVSRSKHKTNLSESADKTSHSFDSHHDKGKSDERSSEEKKGEDKKEEKKNKESSGNKSSSSKSSSKDKGKESQKKSSKSEKSSEKSRSSDSRHESKDNKSSEKDSKQERRETPKKCPENGGGLTEEDMAIFAQFSEEPFLSMYDKVKRRSTDKKMKIEKETEVQKKLLCEYKRGSGKKSRKGMGAISESSDMSTDDGETFMKNMIPKAKKKFAFSSDDSDSASDSDDDIMKKKQKSKTSSTKPKRIPDIYSSDSEEEDDRMTKPPAKTTSSSNKLKKNEVVKENDHHNFNFDSLSDSDHKTTSTRPAKPKTVPKSNEKASKSTKTPASTNGPDIKKNAVNKLKTTKRKDLSFKDLFSDDSDDSLMSDSDSDSDISGIMVSPKPKKKVDHKNDKDKKKLPKGSSIYTTSDDSLSDDDTRPPTPITSGHGGKSDGFTSDPDLYHKEPVKNKDTAKKNKKLNESSLMAGLESIKSKFTSDISDKKLFDKIEKDILAASSKKVLKQKSKDKSHKDEKKLLNNRKSSDSLTDDLHIIRANSIHDVYSEAMFEKDNNKLFSNLTNKDNVPHILSDHGIEQALQKFQGDSVKKEITPIQEEDKTGKLQKIKNKKRKKENKKKKKSKEKEEKESPKDKSDSSQNAPSELKTEGENVLQEEEKLEKSENVKPEADPETSANLNSVTRNLFDDMKEIKTSGTEEKKKKKKKKENNASSSKDNQTNNEQKKFEPKVERLSDSDFLSDSDKKKELKSQEKQEKQHTEVKSEKNTPKKSKKSDPKIDPNADVFDFNEEEDNTFKKIKESHMKIMKPDSYDIKGLSIDEDIDSSNIPVEIQGIEIEYQSEDHEIKEDDNICPVVETSEVVIEQTVEEKVEKPKPKPRKRKGRKNSGKDDDNVPVPDLTVEAVSSLEKEQRQTEDIQTEVVHFDAPVSNEQELVIDEGVSLHVEDEASKAVESIITEENVIDETAKAVESILFGDEMVPFTISEPVEPTPQLDQDYLQPEFAPGLTSGIPQIGNEVETTTASPVAKGRKTRKGRRNKSGQSDLLLTENANVVNADTTPSKQESNKFDYFEDTSYASDISNLHDQNDDDDDGRLQIDFDPPKPEPKQKKQRKPRQPKAKLADAAALAAENKMPNLFGNFHPEPEQNKDNADMNRDSLSSENSELENAKHDDLMYLNREDQRHDSDMMSPDERSASDDTADITKVKRRGRKPKNKDVNSMPIPRTNSPRNTRTTSPRSPRTADPRSPKFDSFDTKLNGVKVTEETLDSKAVKMSTNVFDFDENDETSNTTQQLSTPKQRKPRRKKGETMQSPDRAVFSSPERKSLDKLSIGSPEQNAQFNLIDKKLGLFSPPIQPEEQKLEVQNVAVEEKGPPEPLFKAFFEGKMKESPKTINPLLGKKGAGKDKENDGKLNSPPSVGPLSQMTNVDKTIDDVSKGKFESTDDEAKEESPNQTQKKRQLKKVKEDDGKFGMVKSPLKSPLPNHLNSPPPSVSQTLVLPGMGLHMGQMTGESPGLVGQMSPPGLMSKPGQTPLSPGINNKLTPIQTPLSPGTPNSKLDPLQIIGIQSPRPGLQSPKANQQSPKNLQQSPKGTMVPQSPFRNQPLLSPSKTSGISTSSITTVVSTGPVVTTSASTSVIQDPRQSDCSLDGIPQLPVSGYFMPGVPSTSGVSVATSSTISSVTPSTSVVPSSVADGQKKPDSVVVDPLQKQQQEQQRIAEIELQRQQEHHIRLKEEELKQQEIKQKIDFQKQHILAEKHAKLQEQIQSKEREEMKIIEQKKMMEEQQKKKMLQEHHKMLQQQYEELQRKQALQVAAAVGSHVPPGLLSPGSLAGPRPSLPSPNDGQGGQRPAISAHHQMPPGPPFGLPGQHPGGVPVRPGSIPPHIAQQMAAMRHLVPPLDKPPTSAELELTHQQLQQHIAAQQKAQAQAQQKAQAQAIAEHQAQLAKHEAQQAQAQAKQIAQGKSGPSGLQQGQGKQSGAQQKKADEASKISPNANNRKDMLLQRPPGHGVCISPPGKDPGPPPGSQEAANQLTQQIKQQLAMSQANQPAGHPPQQPHPPHGWPMHGIRPDGPRQPGPMPVTSEARISMPGPVPVIGGNPQQVQRVSPHPPTKSPTVAQTAPNMVHGFSQNQAATPRAPSPAVAKTAERQGPGGNWNASPGSQRPGQSDTRPRAPSTEGNSVRPEMWGGINGPASSAGHSLPGGPRPAHQQPPSAHRQHTDHLHLTPQGHGEMSTKDKFIHQQREKQLQEFQRQQELMHHEMQRHHLLEQALQAKAQKEVQLHKERERAEGLEREKRDRESRSGIAAQSPSDPHHSAAIARMGYPFAEPRPPSRDGKMPPQSPALVDPRDPRFPQQFPGHHPSDLRLGSTSTSAFSPASGSSDPHISELQRFQQQNGMIPPGYGLRMLEPHLMGGSGHGHYMLPGLPLSYMAAQQQMDQAHLIDGRPPSHGGPARPPSTQSIHTLSPTQAPGVDSRNPNRPGQQGQVGQARDPHPGDGSLLNLLQRYPVMWQGVLGLKNDQCVVQMHFISGYQPLVKLSLPQQGHDGTVQPLRIAQRMRLEQTQLEGVSKRMTMEKDYCMMLALPCGRDTTDIYQQTKAMSSGFIQYLQQKQAAGIVNVADPGSQQPAYVVHIFPPCEFSQNTLSRLGFDLLYQVKDLAHLIVIIATVA